MPIIAVTARQLQAMLVPAVRYKEAFVVRDASVDQLRALCDGGGIDVLLPIPPMLSNDDYVTIVRLLRPVQRESAMLIPYSRFLPKIVLTRVTQLRLVAK